MTDNPLVSVLIANYNNCCLLQEAIDSVFSQTYTNWEIILVDDGSTDNSFEIYKKYEKDSRFHIYYNEINRGCGFTKRSCVEKANGEICGFLDSDDALLPHALELMVNIHSEKEDIALVFSRMYICDADLNVITESRVLQIPDDKTYFTNLDYGPEHFVTFKRNKYKLTEGISEKCLGCEDIDLFFKLEEVGRVYILNDFTYKYRTGHSNSVSTTHFYEDHLWGIIVKHNACLRRGLDTNVYALQYLKIFGEYIYGLGVSDGEKRVTKSKSYRLGKSLLKPYLIIQGIFKK